MAEEAIKEEKKRKFDFYALKQLCVSDIISGIEHNSICGYTKEDLRKYIERPHLHGNRLISIVKYIYFHSGYFQKIIQYYVNLVKSECWTVDTEILTADTGKLDKTKFKKDYFRYIREVTSFNLESELPKILFSVFMYDAYFGYVIETDEGKTLFQFAPEDCIITGYRNGIPCFAVKSGSLKSARIKGYPKEIRDFFAAAEKDPEYKKRNGYVKMPYDKTICIKYNDGFDFLYPPFVFIIKEILDLEDFKDIEKTRAENDVYKLVSAEIPVDDYGMPTMSGDDVADFSQLALDILAKSIGFLPTPFKLTPIEFETNTSNNINNVKNAIDEMYSELGVSQSLMSGATSGSELKTSIEVDASNVYRILKQVSRAVNFHCRLRLTGHSDYRFVFRYLDITAFNQADKVDELLKLAQASCPVKTELMAAVGKSPLKMFGNAFVENDIFELTDNWIPMQTSYTQSADNSDNNGRPAMDESDISEITQNTHDNESNDADNRYENMDGEKMNVVNVLDKDKAEFLRKSGFPFIEQRVNDGKTVYTFIGTPELVSVITKNFDKNDFYFGKTLNF